MEFYDKLSETNFLDFSLKTYNVSVMVDIKSGIINQDLSSGTFYRKHSWLLISLAVF